jgi:hypothetical protein
MMRLLNLKPMRLNLPVTKANPSDVSAKVYEGQSLLLVNTPLSLKKTIGHAKIYVKGDK